MNSPINQADTIILECENISKAEDSVRNYINTGRYQSELLKNSSNWNQICSSLDTIGDTLLSIIDFAKSNYPTSSGLKYIYTYGILQALFIQQDAIRNLSLAFSIPVVQSEKLKEIRKIRNAAIGHPTKQNADGVEYYNYISRMTLKKWGFTLLRTNKNGGNSFIDVKLDLLVIDQLKEIQISYTNISSTLSEADKMHKEKFNKTLVSDIFGSGFSYQFQKVAEGIHTPDNNRSFGLSMLKSIRETYKNFENELVARNELSDYTKYDLEEYKHAIEKLHEYLSDTTVKMSEADARIYCFYIREQHNRFVNIAMEIDSEYGNAE